MTEPQPNLASVEGDLFGTLFSFVTLLRESSLDDEKKKVVADRIKTLLDAANADMKAKKQVNLAERLDAAYKEAKRLVAELSHSDDGDKGKKGKRKKIGKTKP